MPRYSLSDFDDDFDEQKEEEIEPPHPIGFGSPWGRTWISLEPPPILSPSRSTYALDFSDDEDDDFLGKQEQSYPPLSAYIHAGTAPTAALLQYREPRQLYDNEEEEDDDEEDDDLAQLLQQLARQKQTYRLPQITSPSKPLPSWSQTNRKIEQKIQLERQRMEQEHMQANKEVQGLVQELERQVASIMKTRQAEEDALRKEEEEERLRKETQAQEEAQEKERKVHQGKQAQAKKEQQLLEYEKQKKERAAEASKKTEYVTKAKKLVAQLVQVRASIEPFEKNKAVSKRRLGMKKIVRGKVNTLSENAGKVQEVAMQVSQAISLARQEDEQIKQCLERKDPGLTSDMARGKRYFLDLLASNTIQRVQAEGFNGTRGDGFPLAAMLSMVSVENKDLVPILAAHIYTVCPTAIPTLPSPAPDASEEDLMSSLGMIKDKNGEYESFDRFLSRTENIISLVADIMSSSPSTHAMLGGHKGAVDWLSRFLDLLPPPPTSPLPLLTAPVLYGFLTGAGHMLANKHPESFKQLLDTITKDVINRLDEGAIGKPKSIRLAKLLEGGFKGFQTTLPSKALPELYYGAKGDHSLGGTIGAAPDGASSSNNPFGGGHVPNASPFGQPSGTANPSSFAQPASGATFRGGSNSNTNNNPFGSQQTPGGTSNPFGGSNTTTSPFGGGNNPNAPNSNSMEDASPFGSASNFGAPTSTPFGAPSPGEPFNAGNPAAPSPFGGGSSSGMSGFGSSNTQSGGGFGSSSNSGFGGAALAPSPFGGPSGGPAPTASPFGGPSGGAAAAASPFGASSGGFSSNASPFGAPAGGNQSTPFGGNQGSSSSTFGKPSPSPSPFGNSPGSSFGRGNQNSAFGGGNQNNTFGGGNQNSTFGGGNQGNKGKAPCKFFAQGRCRFGDKCKFSHETGGGGGGNNSGNNQFGGGFGSSNSAPSPFGGPRR